MDCFGPQTIGGGGGGGGGGSPGAPGTNGWTPALAIVIDGERRCAQIVDWIGGSGAKPATGKYVGATGLVATIGDAIDIRGPAGAAGNDGSDGTDGNDGTDGTNGFDAWSPVIAIAADGERRVHRVIDWIGGSGDKPAVDKYIGATGYVDAIGDAVDIRGPAGADGADGSGGGGSGTPGADGDDGWTPEFAIIDDDARRVVQVVDWTGGSGAKPATGKYVGATGLVSDIVEAVDVRGPAGAAGNDGNDGDAGNPGAPGAAGTNGWTPVLSIYANGNARFLKVSSWTGGTGTMPAAGQYVGAGGLTEDIGSASHIEGAVGSTGPSPFKPIAAWSSGKSYTSVAPASYVSINGSSYVCLVNHVSSAGSFAADLAAGKWGLVAAGTEAAIAPGGAANQILAKASATDFDTKWINARIPLTADTTFFVRADGNDGNTGLTNDAAGAFATLQGAHDAIRRMYDLSGWTASVQIADGTWNAGLDIPVPIVGNVIFMGNAASPANVLLSTGSTTAITVRGQCHSLTFKDFKIQTTGGAHAMRLLNGAIVRYSGLDFGACGGNHIAVEMDSQAICIGAYKISGSAGAHWASYSGGQVNCRGQTITFNGGPTFATAFSYAQTLSVQFIDLNTFTGVASGKRYQAESNAAINTSGSGASYLPGNTAGTTSTGGLYL